MLEFNSIESSKFIASIFSIKYSPFIHLLLLRVFGATFTVSYGSIAAERP